jgi:urease accessory protein UreE
VESNTTNEKKRKYFGTKAIVVEKKNLDLAKINKSHSACEATLQYHLGNSQHLKKLGR